MKKAIFLSMIALLIAPNALAVERFPAEVAPSGTTVVVPQVAIDHSPALEMIEIVHYKKDFVKPEGVGNKPPKTVSCYGFISGLAKLIATEDVLINPVGSGLAAEQVVAGIQTAANTWDIQTNKSLFGTFSIDETANFDSIADGRNEVSFGDYSQAGVIAVTRMWGYFSGKASSRYLSQFDMMFDTDFVWGDAAIDATLMDLQNIATHELGHALGLNDQYSGSCTTVTMYGYSYEGDIAKRTLETPDITGLRTLYGN